MTWDNLSSLDIFSKLTCTIPPGKAKTEDITALFILIDANRDKNTALQLLAGKTPRKMITLKALEQMMPMLTGFPKWLIERSTKEAGSATRALALMLPEVSPDQGPSLTDLLNKIGNLADHEPEAIKEFLQTQLPGLKVEARLLTLQLMTGSYRTPATEYSLTHALAKIHDVSIETMSLRRYMHYPQNVFTSLIRPVIDEAQHLPTPFPPPLPWPTKIPEDDKPAHWKVYCELPGIEASLIIHGKKGIFWSQKGLIINDQIPALDMDFPNTAKQVALQGKIITPEQPGLMPELIVRMQKGAIKKSTLPPSSLVFEMYPAKKDASPALIKFLESSDQYRFCQPVPFRSWQELGKIHQYCRSSGYTGLTLIHTPTGQQYFWKTSAAHVHVALMYAELDPRQKNGLKSMTFGVWHQRALVPVAKLDAYHFDSLLDKIKEFVLKNTLEKFGPVRTLKPGLAVELAYDSISPAPRRKSGLQLMGALPVGIVNSDTVHTLSFLNTAPS